jgi:hypothetical protein
LSYLFFGFCYCIFSSTPEKGSVFFSILNQTIADFRFKIGTGFSQ